MYYIDCKEDMFAFGVIIYSIVVEVVENFLNQAGFLKVVDKSP